MSEKTSKAVRYVSIAVAAAVDTLTGAPDHTQGRLRVIQTRSESDPVSAFFVVIQEKRRHQLDIWVNALVRHSKNSISS